MLSRTRHVQCDFTAWCHWPQLQRPSSGTFHCLMSLTSPSQVHLCRRSVPCRSTVISFCFDSMCLWLNLMLLLLPQLSYYSLPAPPFVPLSLNLLTSPPNPSPSPTHHHQSLLLHSFLYSLPPTLLPHTSNALILHSTLPFFFILTLKKKFNFPSRTPRALGLPPWLLAVPVWSCPPPRSLKKRKKRKKRYTWYSFIYAGSWSHSPFLMATAKSFSEGSPDSFHSNV